MAFQRSIDILISNEIGCYLKVLFAISSDHTINRAVEAEVCETTYFVFWQKGTYCTTAKYHSRMNLAFTV